MSPRTSEERQDRRIQIAADRISKELWDMMVDIEKLGGNGITAGLGMVGSTAAAIVDRSQDKAVSWQYLEMVIDAAKKVGAELRAELDADRAIGKPQGSG